MKKTNLLVTEKSKNPKLGQLREAAKREAEVAWLVVGRYLDGINRGERVNKEDILASASSTEVEKEARKLCNFVDILVDAREANKQNGSSKEGSLITRA